MRNPCEAFCVLNALVMSTLILDFKNKMFKMESLTSYFVFSTILLNLHIWTSPLSICYEMS